MRNLQQMAPSATRTEPNPQDPYESCLRPTTSDLAEYAPDGKGKPQTLEPKWLRISSNYRLACPPGDMFSEGPSTRHFSGNQFIRFVAWYGPVRFSRFQLGPVNPLHKSIYAIVIHRSTRLTAAYRSGKKFVERLTHTKLLQLKKESPTGQHL